MNIFFLLVNFIIVSLSSCNQEEKENINNNKEIKLGSNIEIWKEDTRLYKDTTQTEYRFLCDSAFTKVRQLKDGRFEILLEVFDAPDLDKLFAIYLKGNKYAGKEIFPYFEKPPSNMDDDGNLECSGVMDIIDAYENSDDSCYYNPTLYYEITDLGIKLDSALTIKKNKEYWGDFYGFDRTYEIVLPCK